MPLQCQSASCWYQTRGSCRSKATLTKIRQCFTRVCLLAQLHPQLASGSLKGRAPSTALFITFNGLLWFVGNNCRLEEHLMHSPPWKVEGVGQSDVTHAQGLMDRWMDIYVDGHPRRESRKKANSLGSAQALFSVSAVSVGVQSQAIRNGMPASSRSDLFRPTIHTTLMGGQDSGPRAAALGQRPSIGWVRGQRQRPSDSSSVSQRNTHTPKRI